jgi:uncharacterized DUF497 family protein
VRFEWDARKAKANLRKHGVSFDEARTVFDDPNASLSFDYEHADAEDRFCTPGLQREGQTTARFALLSVRRRCAHNLRSKSITFMSN